MGVRMINWYMSKLHKAAHADPIASLAFHRVGNLLASPPSVMRPQVLVRVLLRNMRLAAGARRRRTRSSVSGDQVAKEGSKYGWNPEPPR